MLGTDTDRLLAHDIHRIEATLPLGIPVLLLNLQRGKPQALLHEHRLNPFLALAPLRSLYVGTKFALRLVKRLEGVVRKQRHDNLRLLWVCN